MELDSSEHGSSEDSSMSDTTELDHGEEDDRKWLSGVTMEGNPVKYIKRRKLGTGSYRWMVLCLVHSSSS